MASDREQNVADAFDAMLAFNAVNSADWASFADAVAAFVTIQSSKDAFDNYLTTQESGASEMATAEKTLLKAAAYRRMKLYARTARTLEKTIPGISKEFHLPTGRNEAVLVARGRAFVAAARVHEVAFAGRGLLKADTDALEDILDQIEAKEAEQDSAKQSEVGATAGIDQVLDDGLDAADVADAILRNIYANDPVKLAAWISARHIKRAPKKAKTPPTP